MGPVFDAVIELTTSTRRWSINEKRYHSVLKTLWYGRMCKSLILLERVLKDILVELSQIDSHRVAEAAKRRAHGKSIELMTFGQRLGVIEEIDRFISERIASLLPETMVGDSLFLEEDKSDWRRAIMIRNQLFHNGPGFLESTDLNAGRSWVEYKVSETLDQRAEEMWKINRSLCRSKLILLAINIQGTSTQETIKCIETVESVSMPREPGELRRIGVETANDINIFHSQ